MTAGPPEQTPGQLPLGLPPKAVSWDDVQRDPACGKLALLLGDVSLWPAACLAVTGPRRFGLTSLLKAWSDRQAGHFLTGRALSALSADEIGDLLDRSVAVDDVDLDVDGMALLTLMNLAAERGQRVLLGGHKEPPRWGTTPRDLPSRLEALPRQVVTAPDEQVLEHRLIEGARQHFLRLPQETIWFLLVRMERTFDVVNRVVQELVLQASEQGRPPSVPTARTVLDIIDKETA